MKKSLVVLLIVVLAVGSAFAAISGKFTGTYTYDIDKATLGWDPAKAPKFAFTLLADTKSTENTGDVYAEMAATLNYGIKDAVEAGVLLTSFKFWDAELTRVAINGADWSLNLIAKPAAKTYATSFKLDDDDKPIDNYKPAIAELKGFAFTKNDYSLAFAAEYNPDAKEAISVAAETAEIVSGDIKAQAAAAFSTVASVKKFVGNVKASYGEIATVAADFGYAEKFDFEVAANVKYAPVTFDAYYLSVGKILDLRAVVALEDYKSTITVGADDLVNETRTLNAKVNTTYVEDFDITLYGEEILTTNKLGAKAVYTGVEKTKLTLDASYALATKAIAAAFDAEYTADLYTATFGADFGYTTAASLELDASVKSTKLVSGATLKLAYESGKLLGDAAVIGTVTASCEIAF